MQQHTLTQKGTDKQIVTYKEGHSKTQMNEQISWKIPRHRYANREELENGNIAIHLNRHTAIHGHRHAHRETDGMDTQNGEIDGMDTQNGDKHRNTNLHGNSEIQTDFETGISKY